MGVEFHAKVGHGAVGWAAQALPVLRDGVPRGLSVQAVPKR